MTDYICRCCGKPLKGIEAIIEKTATLPRGVDMVGENRSPTHIDMTGRPDCFEFAMAFLGDPEAKEMREYVEALEAGILQISKAAGDLEAVLVELQRQAFT